jgi:uncharacterized protein (TIGR02679 family)
VIADLERLRDIFGGPEFAWLVERLRKRLENGEPLTGAVTLSEPRLAQRQAIDRLLGRPPSRGSTLTVPLDLLHEVLRHAQVCRSLDEAVELLRGPVRNIRAERADVEARWERLYSAATSTLESRPELAGWLTTLRAGGLLRRYGIEPAELLMNEALRVVMRLPAAGISLTELAAATAGNAHALDPNTSLGALVIRAAASLAGVDSWDDAEGRRDAWAGAGVLCDELSAPVLVLGLRGDASTVTGHSLCLFADAGEPTHLTTRQLLKSPPHFSQENVGSGVFICENPTVVAGAANSLKRNTAPLVCTQGQPTTAFHVLLRQLSAAGVQLSYHGDFDWPGIQIANAIIKRHKARPWRMTAADYERAMPKSLLLKGTPVVASWDSDLTGAMKQSGHAVHEEQVIETLVADLKI